MILSTFIEMKLETKRLIIRELTIKDAPFFFELVNDPDWKRFIGDRNVKVLKDAEDYLTQRIIPSYTNWGFGFYAVLEKGQQKPIGVTGFIKRDELEFPDVGFAFLPIGRGKGFAYESTQAMMEHGVKNLGFKTVLGIANNDNIQSHKLLQKLGLKYQKQIKMDGEEKEISLFSN